MKGIFFNEPVEQNFLGHQFGEVYREKVYEPYLLGRNDLTILDIGGNIGVTTFYFSHFANKVITVEPSKEHFDVLKKMVEFNGLKNVSLVNKAVFTATGKYPLFHNQNMTMFSLHMAVKDASLPEEMVDTITLEDLFKREKLDHVDLMKLDIEGSEIEVLSHASFKNIADKIDMIITERHQWSGRHPNQLVEALRNAGFRVETIQANADLLVARRI